MNDSLQRRRDMEAMQHRWWWLMGCSALLIGMPLAGMSIWPESSFWSYFLAPVLLTFFIAVLAFVVRYRKALAHLRRASGDQTLDDEYSRDSIQKASAMAFAATATLLFIMPLIHYYLTPLSVFVVCWVPLMTGTAVQAFFVHRRLS